MKIYKYKETAMNQRQKLFLATCFYNPVAVAPDAIISRVAPVTEGALLANLEAQLERGGLVSLSYLTANLIRPVCGPNGRPPVHEWVGLRFVPVWPVAKEEADAV
jgi:hypothetical protein